jgi:hypothetical protein
MKTISKYKSGGILFQIKINKQNLKKTKLDKDAPSFCDRCILLEKLS